MPQLWQIKTKKKMARNFKNLKISQFGLFFLKMKYKSRLTSASIAGCDLCEVSVVIPLHFEIKHFTLCVTGLCNEELVEETLKVQKMYMKKNHSGMKAIDNNNTTVEPKLHCLSNRTWQNLA